MTAHPLAASLSERDLQRQVRAYAEGMGWGVHVQWTAIHSPRGFPDLFCVRGPEFVAIELKSERGKVTEHQVAWLTALREVRGCKWAGMVRPSDWYAGALDEVLR